MEARLQKQLGSLERMLRQARKFRLLMRCWLLAAGFGLVLLLVRKLTGWTLPWLWAWPLLLGLGLAWFVWRQAGRRDGDFKLLIDDLENTHPELRHLLSAAVEQQPDVGSGRFGFLQVRLIDEVLTHRRKILWKQDLEMRLFSAKIRQAGALGVLLLVLILMQGTSRWPSATEPWLAREITVSPGDVEVERGTGLLVSARFGGQAPAEATLVLLSASGKTKRLPLQRHLSDPVFGASLMEVVEDARYHIEYGSRKTADYKIRVFDFPALTQADAHFQYPSYTGLTNKTVPDTRRISAVEGTRLSYTLQLNKPVAGARLLNAERTLSLTIESNAVVSLRDFTLTKSARYTLELVDAEGRTNRFPADFTIQVLTNRRPELRLTGKDQRVSPLEEVPLRAEATDDFGLVKYGIGYGVAGQESKLLELGEKVPANEKRSFEQLLLLEAMGARVDDMLSYFAWADDFGPDGEVRRTYSDLYFAEVRPFEEIFRRDQGGGGGGGEPGQSGSERTELSELQKQIIIATWKLQRAAK